MTEDHVHLEDQLTSFRQQWQHELVSKNEKIRLRTSSNSCNPEITVTDQAAQLFLEGVKQERKGEVNAAVYYYRQAVHLVPDIEYKLAEFQITTDVFSDDEDDDENDGRDINTSCGSFGNSLELDSMSKTFAQLHVSNPCSPRIPQQGTHISKLPTELLMLVIKWVVSKDLDTRSLEQLSFVCKWFYACARDEELWKLICLRTWGIHCTSVHLYNHSWRRMFMMKPRVRYNGVYISKNSYVRYGVPSLDSFYKPCYQVDYYRYFRFFTDGAVLVYTSADDPQQVVQLLQHPPYRDPSICKGYYRVTSENMVNVFYSRITKQQHDGRRRKRTNRENKADVKEQNFCMQLMLKNGKSNRNNKLMLDKYTYHIVYRKTEKTCESDIDVKDMEPFFFSVVRSYQAVSVSSL